MSGGPSRALIGSILQHPWMIQEHSARWWRLTDFLPFLHAVTLFLRNFLQPSGLPCFKVRSAASQGRVTQNAAIPARLKAITCQRVRAVASRNDAPIRCGLFRRGSVDPTWHYHHHHVVIAKWAGRFRVQRNPGGNRRNHSLQLDSHERHFSEWSFARWSDWPDFRHSHASREQLSSHV